MPTATTPTQFGDPASLDLVFGALSDPTRRAIVTQLSRGEATMTQIADQFDMTLPGVSKHVSVLENAGLVQRWRSGRTRRCRLLPQPMTSASAWIESQTQFWNDALDALADFVEHDGTES